MTPSRLGSPTKFGVPVFVVLDSAGRYLHSQSSGFLEHDPIEAGLGPQPLKVGRAIHSAKPTQSDTRISAAMAQGQHRRKG